MAQEILGEALAPGAVVGGDGFFATVVDVEAGVFPGEEVGEFSGADELGFAQGVEEAVAGEAGGEVATAEEGFDGGSGGGVERTEILPVFSLVAGEEVVPAVADELPEGRGAGAAGLVSGGHKECS
jgi:hypothetical protein